MPGGVGSRLSALYAKVRPEVALPVLVITEAAPTQELIQRIEGVGGARASFKSALGQVVGIPLTQEAARAVALLPGVRVVQYDEPIAAVKSFFDARWS